MNAAASEIWFKTQADIDTGDGSYSLYYGTSTDDDTLPLWDMTIATPDAPGLSSSNLLESADVTPNLGTAWHDLEVRMLGQDLRFYCDQEPEMFGYTIGASYPEGRIGLCVGYADGTVRWDDIRVRAYVSPEPTVSPGTPESLAYP